MPSRALKVSELDSLRRTILDALPSGNPEEDAKFFVLPPEDMPQPAKKFAPVMKNALQTPLELVRQFTRDELIGIAIARGCRHYVPFVPKHLAVDRVQIPHEILGCALLVGAEDIDTFHAIRVGAMILSDTGCSPIAIASAAAALGVSDRVQHVASVALSVADHPEYWESILAHLGVGPCALSHGGFLPLVSRFSVESYWPLEPDSPAPTGSSFTRIWLRTDYCGERRLARR